MVPGQAFRAGATRPNKSRYFKGTHGEVERTGGAIRLYVFFCMVRRPGLRRGERHGMNAASTHIQQLGEESSVWFTLTPLLKGPSNPLTILMQMADRYGGVIPVTMANQRVVLLTAPEHFKRVLVTKADDYIKYFDGLKPIFGKSMITHDG